MEQASKALKAYKDRKKARQKAREEEACYVEYRKAEILAKFKPKTFPKRRKGSMGFGERKAHYLSIRPKPCYATWLGRRRNVIEAKPSPMAIAASVDMTDHSAVPEFHRPPPVKESHKQDSENALAKKSLTPKAYMQIVLQKKSAMAGPDFESDNGHDNGQVKVVTYGANADNPLINGVPFWTIDAAQEEEAVTDDDLPVDMDILEKVCTGKKTLDSRPFEKIEFNPFGPVSQMKADDPLFDRDTILFSNTVETVIRLQPEGDEKIPQPVDPNRRHIRWADKINVTTFDPKDRRPKDVNLLSL
uniref:Protein LTV1 homolog n=1 Tax=Elaeophora elaphi TaxID=1147741 RepID=A0A0R3S429_9BILA